MLTIAIDNVRFKALQATATELLMVSSGKKIHCVKCKTCITAKVSDLNKARCKQFASVNSLSELNLAWDESSGPKSCKVIGGDYGKG